MTLIATLIGLLLIAFGLVILFLPIPLGLIMIIAGTVIIIVTSARARKFFKWARKRFRWLDRLLEKARHALPERFARRVDETRPDTDDSEAEAERPLTSARPRKTTARPHGPAFLHSSPVLPRYHPPARPGPR